MEEIENIKKILKQNGAILLREGDDIDFFSKNLDELEDILKNHRWIIANKKSTFFEAIKCISNKIYIIEIANTLLHSSRFKTNLKNKYEEKYIENPVTNDIWLKSIRYLLALRNDNKSKIFFYSNIEMLKKNNFFLHYLEENPFIDNLDIDLLFNDKKRFILKYVKSKYLLKIVKNKISFHLSFLFTNKIYSIMGVDGVGKTSIINLLEQYNFKSVYMGFRNFYLEDFYKKIIGKNKMYTFLVHLLVFLENWIRFFKSKFFNFKGYIVIWDRNPVIEYKYNTRLFHPIYKFFFPRIKTFVLYADEKDVYKRKKEKSLEEIRKEQIFFKKLKNIYLIENNDINKTVNKILKEIYENNVL